MTILKFVVRLVIGLYIAVATSILGIDACTNGRWGYLVLCALQFALAVAYIAFAAGEYHDSTNPDGKDETK